MSQVYCLADPIPEIPDLSDFEIPFGPAFSGLPTLPSPIFQTLVIPSLEKYIISVELQFSQLVMTLKSMIDPILGFLNIPLEDWLPKIPGLSNFSIVDILNGKSDKIILEIKRNIDYGFEIPLLPKLYPTLDIPEIIAIQTFQFMMRNYMAMIVTKITSAIAQVTDRLEIAMPVFPVIPSSDQIFQLIKGTTETAIEGLNQSGPIKDINDFVIYAKNFNLDVNSILSKIDIPMLPPLPKTPNIPEDILIPEIGIVAELSNFNMNLIYGLMKMIKDFIDQTLGSFISFAFPTICI